MNKKWEYKEVDVEEAKKVAKENNISELLATVLINRDIKTKEDINVFLNPTRNDFHDPYKIKDMDLAVDRILKAIEKNEKTIIFGDYDVDGITSITVLKKFLNEIGLDVRILYSK